MKKPISYLKQLSKNNNREWFNEHRAAYESSHSEVKAFALALHEGLKKLDEIEDKAKVYRIYRDIRFSKDKTPFKRSWAGGFTRATKRLRGGYYWHIEPDNQSMIGCGFFNPNAADLLHIRKQIEIDATPLRSVINSKSFKDYFGELKGDRLKTVPKGFDKTHESIDLLRFKQYLLIKSFSDAQVIDPNFPKEVVKGFKKAKPFLDVMSMYLTTDLNGEPLL